LPELDDLAGTRAGGEPSSDSEVGATILVVDDDALVRSMLRRILVSRQYDVIEAESAAVARTVIERQGATIRLIILDHSMPNESGVQAIASLRNLSRAPIVLFTGLTVDVPGGVAALLEKPARPSEVFRIVREVLDRERAAG
jgi:DNA-binding response OmpR family regulator